MARARYFRESNPHRLGSFKYIVQSDKPSENKWGYTYYPTGEMSLWHSPRTYSATYSNESTHPTGLSEDYLNKLESDNRGARRLGLPEPHPSFGRYSRAREDFDELEGMTDDERELRESQRTVDLTEKHFARSREGQPETLFVEHPPQTQITRAFFDKSMTVHAPIMASLIHQDFGGEITADNDLSPHSSQFVKKAQEMGLPVKTHEDNPNAEVSNDLELGYHGESRILQETNSRKQVPNEEVRAASKSLKQMIRANRPHMSTQFESTPIEHPKLPGIE